MATPRSIRTEIERLVNRLLDAGLAYAGQVITLSQNSGTSRVSWVNADVGSAIKYYDFATVDEYLFWLDSNNYSVVLNDGAVLQLSYEFSGARSDLVAHRLAYFPCPVDITLPDPDDIPPADLVRLSLGKASSVAMRTPIRFDFDVRAQQVDHPASHVTLNYSHCRCPVVGPLSPGHFVKFIFRQFYPTIWEDYSFLRSWRQSILSRTITRDEELALHIGCLQS
jgi:hypothetical protein